MTSIRVPFAARLMPLVMAAVVVTPSPANAQASDVVAAPAQAIAHLIDVAPLLPTAASPDGVELWAKVLLGTPQYRSVDATIAEADSLIVSGFRFGQNRVVRVRPVVDEIQTEGADRVFTFVAGRLTHVVIGAPIARRGAYILSKEEAVAIAAPFAFGSMLRDPTVENTGYLAQRVFLGDAFGVRAAYRVRIPTFRIVDAIDAWIDASTGALIKTRKVALAADGGIDDAGTIDDGGSIDDAGTLDAGTIDAGALDAGPGDDDGGIVVVDAGPFVPPPAAPTAARIFRWAPNLAGVSISDLVMSDLIDLADAELGSALVGRYIETRNCCKAHVCLDGSATCDMNDAKQARCATADDDDPIASTIAVEIPTDFVPFELPFDVLHAKSAFCAELPRVRSRAAAGPNPEGWFEAPVDAPADQAIVGPASEEDSFAEVQAYAAATAFFLHHRDTIDDDTFCLRDLSMACEDDGSPTLDEFGQPVMPFRVAVNALIPDVDLNAIALQVIGGGGAGSSPGNPVTVENFARQNTAVFLPALTGGPINVPVELEVLTQIFTRTFDSAVFFQGDRDYAYDGSVVMHEFTHAIIYSMNPDFDQYGVDEQGSNAFTGALSEAYADYFSSSFRNDPIVGRYSSAGFISGEVGLRNASNELRCPANLTGDLHADSQLFSGALWSIREAIVSAEGAAAVGKYDQRLWQALAEANNDETFEDQLARVLDGVEAEFGNAVRFTAEGIFAERSLDNCNRVFPMSIVSSSGTAVKLVKDGLFLPVRTQLGLANYTPAAVQFRIEVPARTAGFTLRWDQAALIQQQFGGEPAIMSVLAVETDGPITWAYEGTDGQLATPRRFDGAPISFNPEPDQNRANMADPLRPFYNVSVVEDPCAKKIFHVVFANIENSAPMLNDITLEILAGNQDTECVVADAGPGGDGDGDDDDDDAIDPPVCGCDVIDDDATSANNGFAALLVVGLIAVIRRRRA